VLAPDWQCCTRAPAAQPHRTNEAQCMRMLRLRAGAGPRGREMSPASGLVGALAASHKRRPSMQHHQARLQQGRMSASFACDELPKLTSGRAPRLARKRARFLRGLSVLAASRRRHPCMPCCPTQLQHTRMRACVACDELPKPNSGAGAPRRGCETSPPVLLRLVRRRLRHHRGGGPRACNTITRGCSRAAWAHASLWMCCLGLTRPRADCA
jgi:hypothetical protein